MGMKMNILVFYLKLTQINKFTKFTFLFLNNKIIKQLKN